MKTTDLMFLNAIFLFQCSHSLKGPFIFYGVGGTGGILWEVPVKYNDRPLH